MEVRKPGFFLDAAHPMAAEIIGEVITRIDRLLEEVRPDVVLILGDANSCLGCIAANRCHIPVFHMEATWKRGTGAPTAPTAGFPRR